MNETPRQHPSSEADAAKLRGILESALTAIITINEGALIEAVNPAVERLFGYSAADLIGKNVKILMPEPYRAEHDAYISNYLGSGTKKIIGIGREVRGRRSDGATFPLHLSVCEFTANGQRYFTGMIQDLSDRKHVEESKNLKDALSKWLIPKHAIYLERTLGEGNILFWLEVADPDEERSACQSLLATSSGLVGVHDFVLGSN